MGERTNSDMPHGTVTFLFTDIEGSTKLWEHDPGAMAAALARHNVLLQEAIEQNDGYTFKTIGDAFCAAFPSGASALAAALAAQLSLAREQWPPSASIKVRMALHTGVAEIHNNDYFGQPLNRAARLVAAGHGGQILVSLTTQALLHDNMPAGATLRDLGERRLKDLIRPERVYQLVATGLPSDFPPLKTLDARANNLPAQSTSFVGREREMREIKSLLQATRMLTLTGSGGAGKTRLALQVADHRIDTFADGVWFVELASLSNARLVPQAVATALGIKEQVGESIADTLIREAKDKELLLLLDNCEHVVAASAELSHALLAGCANVQILVTSREALRVPGEVVYRLPSLATPDREATANVASLTAYPAVQLFIDRARAVKFSFQVTSANASAVASICHHLDGIPLAIELAAARMKSLAVEEINDRLDQRFQLLTGGVRTALPRQQTLRALINWSYELLNDTERALFDRLTVFAGGWTLAAAEGVCSGEGVDEGNVLDLLTSLADKSLVLVEERRGTTRYGLLETVRQYARDRLHERDEEVLWQGRHLTHFLALAEEAEGHLRGGVDQEAWLGRLAAEHDNLRSALQRATTVAGEDEVALRLAAALERFWLVRGYVGEGHTWLSAALAASSRQRSGPHAKALTAIGWLALYRRQFEAAREFVGESLAIRRELGDQQGVADSLGLLGTVSFHTRDYPSARALGEASLALRHDLGDRRGIASSLDNLGLVVYFQGDYVAARAMLEESVVRFRELGDLWDLAGTLGHLGFVTASRGDHQYACGIYKQALAIARQLGDRTTISISLYCLGISALDQGDILDARALLEESLSESGDDTSDRAVIPAVLEALGDVALASGGAERATRILGGVERLREEIGVPVDAEDRVRHDRSVAAARAAMGDDDAFQRAWQAGRAMTMEQVIENALENAKG